jgi:hypothetical protein
MKYGAQQISFPAHKFSTCEPLISAEIVGWDASLEERRKEKTLATLLLGELLILGGRNTHTTNTQQERREEEEGEANLSRFDGFEPTDVKLSIRGSNVLGLDLNLVSSICT